MSNFDDYQKKINRHLNEIEAKISYLQEGMQGLNTAFKDFQFDLTEFMSFSAEHISDHERRIKALEKKNDK